VRYFTKVFKDNLQANANVLDGLNLRLVLFHNAPSGDVNYDYSLIPTAAKLIAGNYPGWELVTDTGYPLADTIAVNPEVIETFEYTLFTEFPLLELDHKVGVMALGVEAVGTMWGETDPLILVTDLPFPNGRTVVAPDDVVTGYQDPKVGDQRWLLAWDLNADGALRVASLRMGDIAVSIGPPDYQSSHHFNAWLYPQRVNYIANPSFEAVTNQYWGTNGAFARVVSDIDADEFAGQFTGADIVVESNTFPIDKNDGIWTTQLLIKGTGLLSLGLVFWSEAYDKTYVDWGEARYVLNPDTFTPIKAMRTCSEAVEGMLRLQVEGGTGITIDRVLAEPGPLIDWPYFDGDEQYGAQDDFSWYGVRGESFSLWYNNRRSVVSRIFTQPTYTGSVQTEETNHGLAYNWVPAGTIVDYHLDVLRPDDLKQPPIPKSGVMPTDATDPLFGVPWSDNVLTSQYLVVLTAPGTDEVFIAGGT
jgi:hypothetical protein